MDSFPLLSVSKLLHSGNGRLGNDQAEEMGTRSQDLENECERGDTIVIIVIISVMLRSSGPIAFKGRGISRAVVQSTGSARRGRFGYLWWC